MRLRSQALLTGEALTSSSSRPSSSALAPAAAGRRGQLREQTQALVEFAQQQVSACGSGRGRRCAVTRRGLAHATTGRVGAGRAQGLDVHQHGGELIEVVIELVAAQQAEQRALEARTQRVQVEREGREVDHHAGGAASARWRLRWRVAR